MPISVDESYRPGFRPAVPLPPEPDDVQAAAAWTGQAPRPAPPPDNALTQLQRLASTVPPESQSATVMRAMDSAGIHSPEEWWFRRMESEAMQAIAPVLQLQEFGRQAKILDEIRSITGRGGPLPFEMQREIWENQQVSPLDALSGPMNVLRALAGPAIEAIKSIPNAVPSPYQPAPNRYGTTDAEVRPIGADLVGAARTKVPGTDVLQAIANQAGRTATVPMFPGDPTEGVREDIAGGTAKLFVPREAWEVALMATPGIGEFPDALRALRIAAQSRKAGVPASEIVARLSGNLLKAFTYGLSNESGYTDPTIAMAGLNKLIERAFATRRAVENIPDEAERINAIEAADEAIADLTERRHLLEVATPEEAKLLMDFSEYEDGAMKMLSRMGGTTRIGRAEVKLVPSDLSGHEDAVLLDWLSTPPEAQGQGQAGKALDEILDVADETGTPVVLQPEARGVGLDDESLTAFYGRHGFEFTEEGVMRYEPGTPRTPSTPDERELYAVEAELRRVEGELEFMDETDEGYAGLVDEADDLERKRADIASRLDAPKMFDETTDLSATLPQREGGNPLAQPARQELTLESPTAPGGMFADGPRPGRVADESLVELEVKANNLRDRVSNAEAEGKSAKRLRAQLEAAEAELAQARAARPGATAGTPVPAPRAADEVTSELTGELAAPAERFPERIDGADADEAELARLTDPRMSQERAELESLEETLQNSTFGKGHNTVEVSPTRKIIRMPAKIPKSADQARGWESRGPFVERDMHLLPIKESERQGYLDMGIYVHRAKASGATVRPKPGKEAEWKAVRKAIARERDLIKVGKGDQAKLTNLLSTKKGLERKVDEKRPGKLYAAIDDLHEWMARGEDIDVQGYAKYAGDESSFATAGSNDADAWLKHVEMQERADALRRQIRSGYSIEEMGDYLREYARYAQKQWVDAVESGADDADELGEASFQIEGMYHQVREAIARGEDAIPEEVRAYFGLDEAVEAAEVPRARPERKPAKPRTTEQADRYEAETPDTPAPSAATDAGEASGSPAPRPEKKPPAPDVEDIVDLPPDTVMKAPPKVPPAQTAADGEPEHTRRYIGDMSEYDRELRDIMASRKWSKNRVISALNRGTNPVVNANMLQAVFTASTRQRIANEGLTTAAVNAAILKHADKRGNLPLAVDRLGMVKNVTAKGGQSLHWRAIVAKPGDYNLTTKQDAFIRTLHQLTDEVDAYRVERGLALAATAERGPKGAIPPPVLKSKAAARDAGEFYVPGLTREKEGVKISGSAKSSLPQTYKPGEAPADQLYGDILETYYDHILRSYEEIADEEFKQALTQISVKPSALVPTPLKKNFEKASYDWQAVQGAIQSLQRAKRGEQLPPQARKQIKRLFPALEEWVDDSSNVTLDDLLEMSQRAEKHGEIALQPVTPPQLKKARELVEQLEYELSTGNKSVLPALKKARSKYGFMKWRARSEKELQQMLGIGLNEHIKDKDLWTVLQKSTKTLLRMNERKVRTKYGNVITMTQREMLDGMLRAIRGEGEEVISPTTGKARTVFKGQAGLSNKYLNELLKSQRAYRTAMERAKHTRFIGGERNKQIGRQFWGEEVPDGPINLAEYRGKLFPQEWVKGIESLDPSLKRGATQSPWSVGFESLGNHARFLSATFDFAAPLTHGFPLLMTDPVRWAKATARHFQALVDPAVMGRYIDANLEDFQDMARAGVTVGDSEFFTVLREGKGISAGAPLEAMLGKRARHMARTAGKQTVGRFGATYDMFVTAGRHQLWQGHRGIEDMNQRGRLVRNMTGGLDSRALGVNQNQRGGESTWLAFSPKLLRSTLALTKMALTERGPQANAARHAISNMLAGTMMIYIATGMALKSSDGELTESEWDEIKTGLNPLEGKKFLAHKIGGQYIGIGGQWRSLAQVLAGTGAGAWELSQGEYPRVLKRDRWDNPLVSWYMNRGAPGITMGGTFVEFGTGWNANPETDNLDSPPDLALAIGQSFLPFSLKGIAEGNSWYATTLGMGGLRVAPPASMGSQAWEWAKPVREMRNTVVHEEGVRQSIIDAGLDPPDKGESYQDWKNGFRDDIAKQMAEARGTSVAREKAEALDYLNDNYPIFERIESYAHQKELEHWGQNPEKLEFIANSGKGLGRVMNSDERAILEQWEALPDEAREQYLEERE